MKRTSRAFAREVAEELLQLLSARDIVIATDAASRRREESDEWRDRENTRRESSDPTKTDEDGESSMSVVEARRLLNSLRQRRTRCAR
jgi:hypothetical protein